MKELCGKGGNESFSVRQLVESGSNSQAQPQTAE